MKYNKHLTVSERFFHEKFITPFMTLLLAICCVGATASVCFWVYNPTPTMEQLYQTAVMDSITVEEGEILPLVTITKDSDMVTWKDDKIFLMTINSHPERYITGETITLPSDVWTFTDKEIKAWYNENKNGVSDWAMRLKQLIGVPPDSNYTHVSAMWVSPDDIRRPAYNTDITSNNMFTELPKDVDVEYSKWFNENIIWSYFDSAYPWTRLGYTYDWADNCDEYGLTEFWISPEAKVTVEYTDTIDEFIKRLAQ